MGFVITGSGLAVPEDVETSADLAHRVGWSAEEIVARSGVRKRHVARPDDDVAELAARAARQALADGAPPDLIINASAGTRQALPDTSTFVARELGFEGIPSFSVNSACLSFMAALRCATALIAVGANRRILIVSADLCSRARNFAEPESSVLLGDGAAAVVVDADENGSEIVHYEITTWPSGAALTEIRGYGWNRQPQDPRTQPEDHLFHMDGPGVFKRAAFRTTRYLRMLDEEVMRLSEIDLVVPHQMSGNGLALLKRFGFRDDAIVDILADYGNCAAASLPMALATAFNAGRIRRGQHVLLIGTAAGLSVGGMLIRW
jgi:3-oxoacyl-[acyl-carrier-protein] synthase-3